MDWRARRGACRRRWSRGHAGHAIDIVLLDGLQLHFQIHRGLDELVARHVLLVSLGLDLGRCTVQRCQLTFGLAGLPGHLAEALLGHVQRRPGCFDGRCGVLVRGGGLRRFLRESPSPRFRLRNGRVDGLRIAAGLI